MREKITRLLKFRPGDRPSSPAGLPAAVFVGDNPSMSEWVMFAIVATIVGVLVLLLRLGVGDDDDA